MAGLFIRLSIEVRTKLRILPSLYAGYCIYKAVHKAIGDDRGDQKVEDVKEGSLLVSLRCFTDKRFLEVFEDYKSGKIETRLEEEFSDIGIETEGFVVRIENIDDVKEKAAAIKSRFSTDIGIETEGSFVVRIENIDDVEKKAAAIKTGKTSPQIIVQGGAYKQRLGSDIEEPAFKEILKYSAKNGYKILTRGGTAVDAVEAAVNVLEDNEYFNAGRGSLLNNDGEVECDAMIMDGNTLNSGAVTSGCHFSNPVSLAKLIMENSHHCGLSGEGALKFAKEKGFPLISDTKQLIARRSKKNQVSYDDYAKYVEFCMRARVISPDALDGSYKGESSTDTVSAVAGEGCGDTVSAVARDAYGNFACAVSTGGVAGKLKGRVSDASMVGCGGYANKHGAATTSGLGESLIKMTLAREVVYMMESGQNAQDSAKESLDKMKKQLNDVGGVIAIDQQGNFGKFCTTPVMGWASIKDRKLQFGLRETDVTEEIL